MNQIKIENLSKKFQLGSKKPPPFLNRVLEGFSRKKQNKILALDNISLEVKKGEFLGIIGKNGAGKTTLLRILAGIYPYDSGKIETKGNLATVLGLDMGLKDRLTLRENVDLSCTLLGMDREKISNNLDSIIEFSELDGYQDTKLYKFSTGMRSRLAFSIAIQQDFDVLLVDESIAPGDSSFREKCYDRLQQFKRQSKTILFGSQYLDLLRPNLWDRIIWIDKGKIIRQGEEEVLKEYLQKCKKEVKK